MKIHTVSHESGDHYAFECPGCEIVHVIDDRWTYNANSESPTFTQSYMARWTHAGEVAIICHLFVTDGKIQFLDDSTHDLAGQTVEMLEWSRDW